MNKLPISLAQLNVALETGMLEDIEVDFKEMLPDKRNNSDTERLTDLCCAFANSSGGLIIFGVKDDRSISANSRIVGIDSTIDFFNLFGEYPSRVYPRVPWTPQNPPISLPGGKVVHVIHIPTGLTQPYCVRPNDGRYKFKIRTEKGNEDMDYISIRNAFVGTAEKASKIELLKLELQSVIHGAISAKTPEGSIGASHSLVTLDVSVIESVLTETFSFFIGSPAILECLSQLRSSIRIFNNKQSMFFGTIGFPMTGKATMIRNHNKFINSIAGNIASLATRCLADVEKLRSSTISK